VTALPTIAAIQSAVASEYGVTVADLKGPSTLRKHSRPRHAAITLSYRLTDHSKARIATFFRRHPNLALFAIRKIERRNDPVAHEAMRRVTLALVRR
jgi:chromosomal replication initiation ATPase DnaA